MFDNDVAALDTSPKYCVGFLFSPDDEYVALISKLRPKWQAGLFNGIGGHIEKCETASAAMIREFKEEAGMIVTNWRHFAALGGNGFLVHCFETQGDLWQLKSQTDERVTTIPVEQLHNPNIPLIPNLRWLIPLALNRGVTAEIKQTEQYEKTEKLDRNIQRPPL
jgi:8-oxo-dGTP diphosphatase